jgi:hypothetical protein
MGGVEHEREPVFIGNASQGLDVATTAPEMNSDQSAGSSRDQSLNPFWIDVVRSGVDVAEHRRNALPLQRMRSRDKRERGHDDFTGESSRPHRYLQTYRSVTDRDAVSYAKSLSELPLEFLDVRSVVGQPTIVEDRVDTLQESASVADIGASDVEFLLKYRTTTEYGQIRELTLSDAWAQYVSPPERELRRPRPVPERRESRRRQRRQRPLPQSSHGR